jgi:hypothetical protein
VQVLPPLKLYSGRESIVFLMVRGKLPSSDVGFVLRHSCDRDRCYIVRHAQVCATTVLQHCGMIIGEGRI